MKKEYNCPVCDANDFEVLYNDTLGDKLPVFGYNFTSDTKLHYRIIKCKKCFHIYTSPRHHNLYLNYNSDEPDEIYLNLEKQRRATDLKVIQKIIQYKSSGKLLDVGCATGDFLDAAKKYFETEGLEISEWSSKMAEDKGIKIHKTLLNDLNFENNYDVITLWGVIEHFEFPKQEILNINRILKKDGFVFLWTGDISSVTAKIMGEKWHYIMGQHIQLFSKKSIRELFLNNGFSEVEISTYPYVITMESLSNTLNRYPSLKKIIDPLILSNLFKRKKITLYLPGEMFAVFKKQNIE